MSKYIAVSNSDSDLQQNQQQPQPQLQPPGLPSLQISRTTIPPVPSPLQPTPPQLIDDYDSDVEFLDEIPRPKQAQQQHPPQSPPPRYQTPPITTQFASSRSITLIEGPPPKHPRTTNCENDSNKKNLEEPQTRSHVNDDSGDEHEIDEADFQRDPLANLLSISVKDPIQTDGQNILTAMNADKNEVEQRGSGNVEATNVNVGKLIDIATLYKLLEASGQMSDEKTNDAKDNFLTDQKQCFVNKPLSIDADDDDPNGIANYQITQTYKPLLSDATFTSTSKGSSQDNIEGKGHVKTCLLTYSDETSISKEAKRTRLGLHEPHNDENDDDDSGFDFLSKEIKEKAKTVLNMSSADLMKWKFKLSSVTQTTTGLTKHHILVPQGPPSIAPPVPQPPLPQQLQSNYDNISDFEILKIIQPQSSVNDDSGEECEIEEPDTQAGPLVYLFGNCGKDTMLSGGPLNADKDDDVEKNFGSGGNDTTGTNIGDIADLMTTATCSNFASCNQASDSDSEVIEITDGTGKQSCVNVNSKLTILEKVVLTYPEKGDVCPAKIRGEPMKTLRPNEEVNDEVIRFAFKHAMSLLDTELSKKIALADPTFGGLAKDILKKEIEYLVYPYLHKNGDIRHWFLVIATGFHKIFQKPLLLKEDRVLHLPYTIAFLNSMPTIGQSSYDKIKKDIEGFFEKTCQEYQKISKVSVKHCGDEAIPELFGQRYGNDCGVYMVEYFKYFFSSEDVRVCLQCPTPSVPQVKMEMELLGDLLRSREKVGKLLRKMLSKDIFDLIAQQNGKPFCDKLRKELKWDAIDFGPDPNKKHELLVKYKF